MLVVALHSIAEAATRVRSATPRAGDRADVLRSAERNGTRARRFLEHRALAGVERRRITGRERHRVATAKRGRPYRPALDVLARGIGPDDLARLADTRTLADHALVAGVAAEARRRGDPLPAFRVRGHALVAGPVTYVHHRRDGGIRVGDVELAPGSTNDNVRAALDRLDR